MTRYTNAQIKEIRKAKTLSAADQKAFLQLLAEEWGKTYHSLYCKLRSMSIRKSTAKKRTYKPRKKELQATPTSNNGNSDNGNFLEISYSKIEIDPATKKIKIVIE